MKNMLRLSTELWMGSVAVKSSVSVYTTRIATAEETWPHSSPAPSEGHTVGAVRKHGPHPYSAKPYGCLRMAIPQDDGECHPQTMLSRQVVCVQSRAFFIARFPSFAVGDHHRRTWCDAANVFLHAVIDKHSEILCYFFSLYRKRSARQSVRSNCNNA